MNASPPHLSGSLGSDYGHGPMGTIRGFGFNVIGHVSGNLGLGVSARNIVQALLENHVPVVVHDVDPGLGRGKHDERFKGMSVEKTEELPHPVNLLIFPPPTLMSFVPEHRELLCDPARINAALIWWELPVLPRLWLPTLEFFDVLIAPSGFIRHTLDVGLKQTLTVGAQHPLYLPPVVPDRPRFGLEADDFVLVTSFEISSDPRRKNVLAVVEAFKSGLAQVPRARLIIKLNNAQNVAHENRTLASLYNARAADERIRIVTERLSYADALKLYASSDVYVSLHRSEGLGLGPMEAMALGKAVIATAWSGNMDYMDHTNACLVPYSLVPVTGGKGAYSAKALEGAEALWAEPDVSAAAEWMRRLADDRHLLREIGRRAAECIASLQAEAAKARFALEIEAVWKHRLGSGRMLDRDRLFARLAIASAISGKPPTQSKWGRAGRLLDRHLLWRFRSPRKPHVRP